MPLRRWQRWVRWSFLLVCLFVMWLFLRNILLNDGNVFINDLNSQVFDHWGEGTEDINWLPDLLQKRTEEIPVVVVEEHYEVLKYWFQAADYGVIPMSKNILIHIDGHVDGAVPYDTENVPWFRYPRSRKEIHHMMQRNDMFIVAAALTGLIDHMVWVWPQWDAANHDAAEKTHLIMKLEMGYTKVKANGGMKLHQMDLCACWRVLEEYERIEGYDRGDSYWECHRQNFTEIEAENGPQIAKSECLIQSRGILEIMSEATAVVELRKINHRGGIILDIDEDFFGCWSDMIPLEEGGIHYKNVKLVSELVSDFLCGKTAHDEQEVDMFYTALLHLVISLKSQSCEVRSQQPETKGKCMSNVDVSNYLIENIPNLLAFLKEVKKDKLLCNSEEKLSGLLLQTLLHFLQNFSIQQLKLLSELGICFETSPPSPWFEVDGHIHVCHGDNVPNSTQVTFYLPSKEDIVTRTASLRKILSSLFQKPNFVTLCRSVRDGYTPKKLFSVIESNILQSLTSVYRGIHRQNIHFDTNLLGGKQGWPERFKTWSKKLLEYLSMQIAPDL